MKIKQCTYRNTFRLTIQWLVAVMWTGTIYAESGLSITNEPYKSKLPEIQRKVAAENGDFHLSGKVIDENGQPLNDVKIEVAKSTFRFPYVEVPPNEETIIVNGSFNLNAENVHAIHLIFSKQGYYNEKRDFLLRRTPEEDEKYRAGAVIHPKLNKEDINIILESRAGAVDLIRYNEVIEFADQGNGVAMNLNRSHSTHASLLPFKQINIELLLTNTLYFTADRSADGKIVTQPKRRKSSEIIDSIATNVTLVLNSPGGGFVPFTPNPQIETPNAQIESGEARAKPPFRQMKQAPEGGYTRTLTLNQEFLDRRLASTGSEFDSLFFYFKTTNKYGKGKIGFVEFQVKNGETKIRLRVNLLIQPDGSRNLNSIDR